jgi:peptidoglycan hydrolase-like amidase
MLKKLGDRHRCPKPPQSRIIHITPTARGQRCLSPSFFNILVSLLCSIPATAQSIDIGVFSLFRPVEMRVSPASNTLLVTAGDQRIILEGHQVFPIRLSQLSSTVRISARDGSATGFRLSIPGKIERTFHGTLAIRPGDHKLIAVVTMDLEVAVASVVAAEMPPRTPVEALKAQAVATRSYYAASPPRHAEFSFCDSTHCQFLREPPAPETNASKATKVTRNLLLEYAGKPFPAQYSAACGGRTRSLEGEGEPIAGYPYYSVPCDYCRRHSPGVVQGHQLGLCQSGAAGMAATGATFRAILDHYYPGTTLAEPQPAY